MLETDLATRRSYAATRATHGPGLGARPHAAGKPDASVLAPVPRPRTSSPVNPAATRGGASAEPVSVSVLAGDPVTGEGAVAYLRSRQDIRVLASDRAHEAEVVLVLVTRVTEETLSWMQRAAQAAKREELRFVLVGDGVREHHLLRSLTYGLVSVIPRQEADFERIVQAIVGMRDGRLELPAVASGWLASQIRSIQRDVLEPKGLNAIGLETREVEVLRLLADGLGTPEIAQKLNYSERTVKNIIHGILTRLKLRNRAHAVAFALRTGTL